jgi:Transglycosylase SLT domain
MTEKEAKAKLKEIKKAMKSFPKEVRRQERAHREEMKIKKAFGKLSLHRPSKLHAKPKVKTTIRLKSGVGEKIHPWRLCPRDQFYRNKHPQKAYPRKDGTHVRGSEHPNECVINRTGKDQLYAAEIQKIAELHFGSLTNLPTDHILSMYSNEAAFDAFIAGWTRYWNEVLRANEPLESNFIKALIASESGFNPNANNGKRGKRRARGLMQVTDESVALLSWGDKELKDHFVNLSENDMLDPNLTICAGIRWLFRKREIAESRSKDITWPKVIMLYKNYRSMKDPQMQKFLRIYEALKTSDKSKLKK